MRKQDVTFGLDSLPVHHDVNLVANLNMNAAIGLSELLDGHQALRLVTKVDDDVLIVKFDDAALQQLAVVWRSKMRIIIDELLVVRFFGRGRI